MTKYLQSCYEWLHSLGPYPRIVKCPFCNRNEWRGDLSVEYIKKNGCILCRYEKNINLVEIKKVVMDVPRQKCRGRYDDLEEIPLNISPDVKTKKSFKNYILSNSKNKNGFLSGFDKNKSKSFTKIYDKNIKISQNDETPIKPSHYINLLTKYGKNNDVEI